MQINTYLYIFIYSQKDDQAELNSMYHAGELDVSNITQASIWLIQSALNSDGEQGKYYIVWPK